MARLAPKTAKLTAPQIQYLCDGGLDQALFNEPAAFPSDAAMRLAWAAWGSIVTRDFVARHPRQRPWAWWWSRSLPCPVTPEAEAAKLAEMGESDEMKGRR